MKNKRHIITIIVLLIIIAIILTGFMGYIIFAESKGINKEFFKSEEREIIYDQSFDANSITDLSIDSVSSDIIIRESNDGNIRVTAIGGKTENFSVNTDNGEMIVESTSKSSNSVFHFLTFEIMNAFPDIVIYLPSEFASPISISSDTGDIDIKCDLNSNLTVDSSTGDFEAGYLSGSFNITADTGDIDIREVEVLKNSTITADTGDITIEKTNDINIISHTSLGDNDIGKSNPSSPISLTVETDVGDIEINDN